MKKTLIFLIAIAFLQNVSAQVGICKTALSLEDNSFVGSLWEPTGTVNYTEENGTGLYGLVIALNTSDEYLDIYEGHKVSIEYTDDTREVLDIEAAPTSYDNTIVNHSVVNIYQRRVLVYPNYENLTQKQIKRIVIQRTNGKVWIINTIPKRAKRLPKEFANAMQEALSSYKTKVSNNNYFEEQEELNDNYFNDNETDEEINEIDDEKWTLFINKNGNYVVFDEKTDIVHGYIQSENCPKGSFNYYRSCLGYLDGEVISHYNNYFDFIALNLFNNGVIFVIPKDTKKKTISKQEVDKYLAGYSPSSSDFARHLQKGVDNKSIRQTFVEESLGVKASDNRITDKFHGYTYIFENGVLANYENKNGLSYEALYVKDNYPQVFNRIQENARKYYNNAEISVARFINGQCKYFYNTDLTYLKMAANPQINYNYAMLYCIFYAGTRLEEFTFLVPEAELSSSVSEYIIMSCGNYLFTFKDKVLIKD